MTSFEDSSIYRLLLKYCVPAIIGMMVQGLTNILSGIFLGQVLGFEAMAAVQYAMPFQLITVAFGTLVGIGACALVSLRLGQKSHQGAEEVLGNALTLILLISTTEIILQLIFLTPLLEMSGASGKVLEMAWIYTFITVAGSIFANLGFGFNNILRAEGNPHQAMVSMFVVAFMSVFLNWLFIVWLRWGAIGAGLAVVIAQFCLCVWVLWFFTTKKSLLKFHWSTLKLKSRTVLPILRIGLSPCIMQIAACVQAAVLNFQLSHFGGEDAMAIMSVIIRVSLVVFMAMTGLSQGAQPIIGYNYGAQQWRRVRQTLGGSIVFATILSTLGFIIIELFPGAVMRLFTPSKDMHLIPQAIPAIRLCLLLMATSGYQIVCVSYFQAIGKPAISICLTIMRRLVFLTPMLVILPWFWGIKGIWAAYAIADACAAVVIAVIIAWEMGRLTHQPELPEISSEKTLVPLPEELY